MGEHSVSARSSKKVGPTWQLPPSKTTIMSKSESLFPKELTEDPNGSTSDLAKIPRRQSSICWQARNRIRDDRLVSSVTDWKATICSSNWNFFLSTSAFIIVTLSGSTEGSSGRVVNQGSKNPEIPSLQEAKLDFYLIMSLSRALFGISLFFSFIFSQETFTWE